MTNENKNVQTWDNMVYTMFDIVKNFEDAPAIALAVKLSEEVGEFSEVILKENGYLKHKTKEFESPFGEAADIINCVISVLTKQYPSMTAQQLSDELLKHFELKGSKYARIITTQPIS